MPQYLLSVHGNEEKYTAIPPEVMERMHTDVGAFNAELMESGSYVFGGGLQAAFTATVVSSDGVETSMTDGPYLEAKEHVGGFWIIEANDLDAALAWAAKGSTACRDTVEVRPFQDEG